MQSQIIDLTDPLWMEILHQLGHDFYHLPEFLDLEANRLQAIPEAVVIREDENVFFLPYLLRQWNRGLEHETGWDVVSPYGYPGFLINATDNRSEFIKRAIDHLQTVWQQRKICSAFLRLHPTLNAGIEQDLADHPALQASGRTVSINLSCSADDLWKQTRENHRRGIRRLKEAGFSASMIPIETNLDSFITIYEETMERVNAKSLYYFSRNYFLQLVDSLKPKIHLCVAQFNQTIAAAALITEHNGIVQYHLGGTLNTFLKEAPMKLIFDYVRFWAKERGNHLFHLGGGLGAAQDSLYNFKLGFANQTHSFSTLRLILDEAQYLSWVTCQAKQNHQTPDLLLSSNFFPAYRVPI
ncbi:MAG TPA: GNAT family N-acetyltransferase [Coleofasciculaceae cyanobacterium]